MIYDVIVVGGGPAGITSAIYAKRANKSVLVIEKFMPGGQLGLIGKIENYTGFKSVDGNELSVKMFEHATSLGVEFTFEEACEYQLCDKIKTIKCNKNSYQGKAIILAQGCHSRELGIDGEENFKGRGVSYCALCDGNFFKGKKVAVVGSGDSAFSDGVYLSGLCEKVYLLTKENLTLHNYAENEFDDKKNVELIKGGQAQKIEMTDKGFIKCDSQMQTSCKGVFACGDIRENSIRQIATAVGDGALAGTMAVRYVSLFDKGLV